MGARRQTGFTLIEVVVAFVLLAGVLAVGFEIFSTGLRRAGDLEDYSRALVIAQSRLATAGVEAPLEDGQASGESDDRRFRWHLVVTRSEEGEPPPGQPLGRPYALFRVEVRGEWTAADTRPRSIGLATLGLGPRT